METNENDYQLKPIIIQTIKQIIIGGKDYVINRNRS